jgi:hypothetical protein|tara:strand:+ start:7144 stop:7362 length:219 start_codon:yes stop_codon:yes gene_type:complete
MKKIFLLLLLVSCSKKEDKYRIEGTIETKDGPHQMVWYTDTISFDNDTIYYYNSDGNEVRIYPPFILKHVKE